MAKATGMPRTAVSRIWRAFALKLHIDDQFKLSPDPQFIEKVRDVVGLYLNPPDAAVVLCVDEKTQVQVQALDGTDPRLCFDQLRSADWQRRSPASLHDMEPPPARDMSTADRITLDDEVRLALHIVMAQLTPAERIAFVLHDVFTNSFDAISEILGRSPVACRQLASRARRTISPNAAKVPAVASTDAHRVAEQFIAACSTGDLDGMLAVMHPDCSGHVDTGPRSVTSSICHGWTPSGRDPPSSAARPSPASPCATTAPERRSRCCRCRPPQTDGHRTPRGKVVVHFTMTVDDGLITRGDVMLDPDKLAELSLILDT
jgi:hypothetical protein